MAKVEAVAVAVHAWRTVVGPERPAPVPVVVSEVAVAVASEVAASEVAASEVAASEVAASEVAAAAYLAVASYLAAASYVAAAFLGRPSWNDAAVAAAVADNSLAAMAVAAAAWSSSCRGDFGLIRFDSIRFNTREG